MVAPVEIPDAVHRKAVALGSEGERWMDDLPSLLAMFEERWGIEVGPPAGAGSVGYVAFATTTGGRPAVLKLAMPDGLEGSGAFARELASVRLGQGRGYVMLHDFDAEHRAMLMERLGARLGDLDLPIQEQIDAIAATVRLGWQRPPDAPSWRTGATQADFLNRCLGDWWDHLGRPCPEQVVRSAQACARRRRDAFDADTAVAIHGDAHAWNVLEHPNDGYRLIDPDGMLSEPAHDLAIPLRHWNEELLSEPDPAARVRSWCARLQETTGADAQAIWEWALAERMSTGMFLLRLGNPQGRTYLDVASRLTV